MLDKINNAISVKKGVLTGAGLAFITDYIDLSSFLTTGSIVSIYWIKNKWVILTTENKVIISYDLINFIFLMWNLKKM